MAQAFTLHPFGQFHRRSFGAPIRLAPQYSLPWTPRSITTTPLVAWYDPSDITTLFTDIAGTVPVTADGDLVACMKDKSGNGNHATQATSGSRPIYRSGGYLDFDGVRLMFTASIQITGTGQHSCGAAIVFTNNTGTQCVLDADNFSASPRLSQLLRNNAGTVETIAFNTAVTTFTDAGPSITAGASTVLSEITNSATTEAFVGGVGNGSTAVTGTLQSAAVVLTVGCFNYSSPAALFTGKFYGSANYQGALSSSDHAQLVAYLTAKMATTGVTGSGASTETADSTSGSGTVDVSGSGASTEAADTTSASGEVGAISGTGASTEATDITSGSGAVVVSGSGADTEASDTTSGAGNATVIGSGAAAEAPDTTSGSGAVVISGSGASAEGTDSTSGSGTVITGSSGSGASSEAPDTTAGVGLVLVAGTGSALEAADACAGTGTTLSISFGHVKLWMGTGFVAKPIRYWNGTDWVTKPLKRWTGTTWQATGY